MKTCLFLSFLFFLLYSCSSPTQEESKKDEQKTLGDTIDQQKQEIPQNIAVETGLSELQQSTQLVNEENTKQAFQNLQKAVESDPHNEKYQQDFAKLLQLLGKHEQAKEHYNKALAINPKNAENHFGLAISLAYLGNTDVAEKYFKQSIQLAPNIVRYVHAYQAFKTKVGSQTLVQFSDTLLGAWQYDTAVYQKFEEFVNSVEGDQTKATTKNTLDKNNEEDIPITLDLKNVEITSSNSSQLTKPKALIDKLKTNEKVIAFFEKKLEENNQDAILHWGYADFLNFIEDHQKAKIHYEQAVQLAPDNGIFHFAYANFLAWHSESEEAKQHLTKAVELLPNAIAVHTQYVYQLLGEGKKEEAERVFKNFIANNPKNTEARYKYALFLLEDRGKIEEAQNIYQELIEIDPSYRSEMDDERFGLQQDDSW